MWLGSIHNHSAGTVEARELSSSITIGVGESVDHDMMVGPDSS